MDLVIDETLSVLVYLTGAFVLLLVGKIVFRVFNPNAKIDYELVENDNPAFAISYVGYFAALIITFSGVILGESQGLGKDLIDMLIFGLLSIVLLNSSVIISNRWIFPRFDAKSEILQKRNVACAIVVAGVAISNGIIIMGAVYGDGEIFPQAFYTTLVCWACGQVILLLFTPGLQLRDPLRHPSSAPEWQSGCCLGLFWCFGGSWKYCTVWFDG